MKYLKYALIILLFTSCASKKDIVYFQDIDQTTLDEIDSIYAHPVVEINDILSVNISALDDNSVVPFRFSNSDASIAGSSGYLVNADGNIQFPILGSIKVKGKTIEEVQQLLQDSLKTYITDPIVQVKIINYKITVLGAVNNPGTYKIDEESISLPQAIGLAGDFNINGKRDNVLLIRQINGVRTSIRVDFTSSDWLNSPYYYLKQNDIIYVEPNFAEVKSAGAIGDFTELLRVVTVATTTIILLTR